MRPHRLARSRTPDFHSDNGGSNPPGVNSVRQCTKRCLIRLATLIGSLAQRLEHLTFNEGVDGSNPSRLKVFFSFARRVVLIQS
jgi:hypothetical protein